LRLILNPIARAGEIGSPRRRAGKDDF